MNMDSIEKSVASSIANSESTTIPSHLHEGAHDDTQPLTGTQSNSTDGASDKISAGSSAPGPVSSNSSLPMLEAAMKATKISPRSCLKSAKRSPGPDGNVKSTKRARFVSDDTLLKCMVTGAHTLPNVHTKKRHEEFVIRACEVSKQREAAEEARRLNREAGIECSDSDSDSDSEDANKTYLLFAAREENRDDDEWDSDGVYARMLESRLHEAYAAYRTLNMRAITGGAVDFALYVTRDQYLLQGLEGLVHEYRLAVQVGSYHGNERRPSFDRGYAVTLLPAELYQDYDTAMSGIRRPQVTLSMPDVPRRWR
ncbi:hypothetical protein BBO_02664 [Beauveria brongniartii RCEF 3172]|uniref:Uncharacterized protein n=1 Tax=Beauveria brongniartii RCEF 3172 TaxID=1081107 RepID=A0A167GX63_9HYPO|nr:hypothetical protein BBO_02664 [Beauveria brongniartii RCEF 3172]